MPSRRAPADAPLFVWPERVAIDAVEQRRRELIDRIAALPRLSHRRVVLEARLRDITAEGLGLETNVRKAK